MKESVYLKIIIITLIFVLVYTAAQLVDARIQKEIQIENLKEENQELEEIIQEREGEIKEREDLNKELRDFLDRVEVETWVATMYAPLDPAARSGMDYSGDPNITASGERVQIGKTIAASPEIPFGTKVWIEGFGVRTVQDRGGAITRGKVDIAVPSRDRAFAWGKREVKVIYMK